MTEAKAVTGAKAAFGIYATPAPLVGYLVRSIDGLLRTDLGLPDGLAGDVQILDPAVGPGLFPRAVLDHVRRFGGRPLPAAIAPSVEAGSPATGPMADRPRLIGCDIRPEPLAAARAVLGDAAVLIHADALTWGADRPADDRPLVVIGNPPYRAHSRNRSPWIGALLRGIDLTTVEATHSYYHCAGRPLGERNAKGLQDDYVKFLRAAQRWVERNGSGIVGFVTNHNYLTGLVFRGLREALAGFFDDLYVLDLHGNQRTGPRAPDGSRDENVFPIRQGVAVALLVRRRATASARHQPDRGAGRIHHAELWGSRSGKLAWLAAHDVASTPWTRLTGPDGRAGPDGTGPAWASAPTGTPTPFGRRGPIPITDLFGLSANGFKTHRDRLAIAFDAAELSKRVSALRDPGRSDADLASALGLKPAALARPRAAIAAVDDLRRPIVPCLYRPLDLRWCYFHPALMDRPRRELAEHVVHRDNLCLAVGRQGQAVGDDEWGLVSIGTQVADTNLFRRGGIQYFPLYHYFTPTRRAGSSGDAGRERTDDGGGARVPGDSAAGGPCAIRRSNLRLRAIVRFAEATGLSFTVDGAGDLAGTFGPPDVMAYLYAVLHAPAWRTRFAADLRTDYPTIPVLGRAAFIGLARLGAELIEAHLLRRPPARSVRLGGGPGPVTVGERPSHDPAGRLWIGPEHWLDGVALPVGRFRVGGYPVIESWLGSRSGRTLSAADIDALRRIVTAIDHTLSTRPLLDRFMEADADDPG